MTGYKQSEHNYLSRSTILAQDRVHPQEFSFSGLAVKTRKMGVKSPNYRENITSTLEVTNSSRVKEKKIIFTYNFL